VIDHAAVARAIGGGPAPAAPEPARSVKLPEPLASVVDYLGEDLDEREFVPSAELVEALAVEPTAFGRQMGVVGCRSDRQRVPRDDGGVRQIRGYYTADVRAAVDAWTDRDTEAENDP
jgi:S-DNA-T family DNA segregation ATPase FtsK/SpoIIIE